MIPRQLNEQHYYLVSWFKRKKTKIVLKCMFSSPIRSLCLVRLFFLKMLREIVGEHYFIGKKILEIRSYELLIPSFSFVYPVCQIIHYFVHSWPWTSLEFLTWLERAQAKGHLFPASTRTQRGQTNEISLNVCSETKLSSWVS